MAGDVSRRYMRQRVVTLLAAAGTFLLAATLVSTVAAQATMGKALPAAQLVPPAEPAIKPMIVNPVEIDANANKIDDKIEKETAVKLALAAAAERATALAQPVRVQLIFNRQITQAQIDAFIRLGGVIDHIYQSVSYGWNGAIAPNVIEQLPAQLGPSLVVVLGERFEQMHLNIATQNGRVRPAWVAGFAGSGSGFTGNTNITIAIMDTGVDGTHTDLTGRKSFWHDYTTDAEPNPRDIIQHGSHVAGISLGTGAAIGASPTQVLYTDSGNLTGVPIGSFYPSPIHMPAGAGILNSTATWLGGGTGTLHGVYQADGGGSWFSLGSASGVSPVSRSNSPTVVTTNHYSAALLSNGSMTNYAIANTATFTGVGDGFNTLSGVAPACKWGGAKVFPNAGGGASSLNIDAALDDMVTSRSANNIKVVNMSFGIGGGGTDPTERGKVNTLVLNGIVAVVSAGNDGPGTALANQIGDPGRAAYAITVAASNPINQLTQYTSSGFGSPGVTEDNKPDVMAPGGSAYYNMILSVDSNSADGETVSISDQQANDYYNIQGTSMASPFTAGAAALVIDAIQQSGTTWDFSSSSTAILVKMLLCATCTESNQPREVASGTDPTLGRAATPKDLYEGYGLLNTDAAIEAVMESFSTGTLTSSTAGGRFDRRAWARKVSLVSGNVIRMNLAVPGTADFDLYVYSGTPNTKGNPVILASSTNAGTGVSESIAQLITKTETGYLVIKRVSGNGTWTLTGGVTSVELASFDATQYGNLVVLDWRTGYEVSNLGFHVYREENGQKVRITPQLLAGSAFLAGPNATLTAGRSYSFCDTLPPGAKGVKYWLEDLDLSGRKSLHGPATPVRSDKPLPQKSQPALLSQIGRKADDTGAKVQNLKAALRQAPVAALQPVRQPLKPVEIGNALLPAAPGSAAQREKQWALAAGPAVKIRVNQEGWYRLGTAELVAAGLNPRVDPRRLQLFLNGLEQPIIVKGEQDGRLDRGDGVEFYGKGQDTLWTDARTYWLAAGERPGKRIATVPGGGDRPGPASFPFTVERRDRTIYFGALRNGEASNFFGPVVSTEPVDQLLAVPHPAASAGRAELGVAFQGVTAGTHRIVIQFNGVEVGAAVFEGQQRARFAVAIPQAALREGDNVVTLAAAGGPTDVSLVDLVRLTYAHTYAADDNALRFTARGGQQVSVQGFGGPDIRVVDVTNPAAPVEVRGQVKRQGGTCSVRVQAPGNGLRTLLAFAPNGLKRPVALAANRPSRWHAPGQAGEVAIIGHASLLGGARPLKALREGQGRSVAVIDVEDLYDEFSFGDKCAGALRAFLATAKSAWRTPPRAVLLLGDASIDPRNFLGCGEGDLVPVKLLDTAISEVPSDDWVGDFNNDDVPDLAVGRLPVRTAPETARVVARIVDYERTAAGEWTDKALVVADNTDSFDFEQASLAVEGDLAARLTVDEVFLGQTDITTARAQLRDKLNAGRLVVNYFGHGTLDAWAGESLLTNDDVEALTNGARLPLVIAMTCLNGFLADPAQDCLAEAFLKAETGGAVAVWASSGLTEPAEQLVLDRAFIGRLFAARPATLGEAARAAKAAVGSRDIRRTWMLLGDPAMRLK